MPQRARRIPDEEWEIWREKLVKLFLEDNVPRKEIVTVMAEKHHFIITDVQLKNRFKKWDVKKYIPDDDLRVMLSLKRKRQRVGKDARFQYKGHDVEQERIERAWKRQRGPLLSPEFVPPHIKMYTSRQHSPQDALYGASVNSTGHHAIPLQSFNMPLPELYYPRGSPSVAFHDPFGFEFDLDFDTPQSVQEPDNHSVTHAGQSSGDLVMGGAPVTAPLQSGGTDFWRDIIPSTEIQLEHSGISGVLHDDRSCEHLSTAQLSRASSSHVSSVDWRRYSNLSPSMRSSSGVPAIPSSLPCYPSRPSSTIRGRTKSSDNIGRASHRRQGSQSMTSQQSDGRVTSFAFDGMDPESIMLPLQLLRSNYIESVELAREDRGIWRNPFSGCSTLDHLYSMFQSNWLSLEMEELICRSYELSTQAIRRRQAARPVSSNGTSLFLKLEDDHECEAPKTGRHPIEDRDFETRLKLKLTSRIWRPTSMGRLNIELSTPPRDSPYVDPSDVPCVINISFIPRTQQRTTGLSAAFRRYSSASQRCHISPRLRTFNVIPDNSQVIDCILRNDISAVQRLFAEGKASPLDVDSRGFSLLSYAMIHRRSSDLFRLLWEGGAGTQNCNSSTNTIDISWTVWTQYMEDDSIKVRRLDRVGFDVGVDMTRLVLKHGCDIEETISFNRSYSNAFSDINAWDWSQGHPMLPLETLGYLLNIGYDLELQSSDGLTSLLFEASQHIPHIIKCLRLFIERGANPHATGFEGQGVLHSALAAPEIYDDWSGTLDAYWVNRVHSTNEANWTARIIFNTEDDGHKEDYDGAGLGPGLLLDETVNNVCHNANGAANEYSIDYIPCEDEAGGLHMIRNPKRVLQNRIMFKLLTLLQLGCDPNIVDHQGLSPSDYAMKDGLWPQWRWALLNAGYVHYGQNGWAKSSLLD